MRKRFLGVRELSYVLIMFLVLFGSQFVSAQDYPAKPIILVVPSGAGSSSDLVMRAATSVAADYLGEPVVIQLKPGGGGAIGSDYVAKAAPDGYTLLAGCSTWNTGLPAVENRSKGPESYEVVCRVNYSPTIISVRPDAPFKNFKELISWVKENPGKLTVGTPGPWSPPDVIWKFLSKEAGLDVKIIPFQGGGKMVAALLGGHIMVGHATPGAAMTFKGTGKMKFLTILAEERLAELPNVPTSLEEGLDPRIISLGSAWRGILAPKGTPQSVIDKLAAAFKKMTESDTVKNMFKSLGEKTYYMGPDAFPKVWAAEYAAYQELGKAFKK